MSILEWIIAAGTLLIFVGLVLLLVRIKASTAGAKQRSQDVPAQRSPMTEAEMLRLNQAYGAGQIGEEEYYRRRKELLTRDG